MTPQSILQAFREGGELSYEGEGITQLQHAWQCGALAAAAGAPSTLQLAAWLHDLGHLLSGLEGSPTVRGLDDRHERLGAEATLAVFGPAVAEPIALHVTAKRYLVATHPGYAERLSADSQRSLVLQGGPMSPAEAHAFRMQPYHESALRLRAWDDLGKRRDLHPDSPEAALKSLEALMLAVLASAPGRTAQQTAQVA